MTTLEGRLGEEGRAAMPMLRATCDPRWADLPMREVARRWDALAEVMRTKPAARRPGRSSAA